MKKKLKIGLEIHFCLKTKTKLFSASPNVYDAEPNTAISPLDLGYPGFLPVTNEKAVRLAIRAGTALHCFLEKRLFFDRKNYIYPDSPKGFQITQKRFPFGKKGHFFFKNKENEKKKIHFLFFSIEEDTAKTVYEKNEIWIDFNRAGRPLLELVTAPEFNSSEDVSFFLQELFVLFRWLEISDCQFEWGTVRADINISSTIENREGEKKEHPLVEIKNLNSLKNIQKSIDLEFEKQTNVLLSAEKTFSSTKRFCEKTKKLIFMRKKFSEADYFFLNEDNLSDFEVPSTIIEEEKERAESLLKSYRTFLKMSKKMSKIDQDFFKKNSFLQKKYVFFKEKKIKNKTIILFCRQILLPLKIKNFNLDIQESSCLLMKSFDLKKLSLNGCKELLNKKIKNKNFNLKEAISLTMNANKKTELNFQEIEKINNIIDEILKNDQQILSKYREKEEATTKYLMGTILRTLKEKVPPQSILEIIKVYFTNK